MILCAATARSDWATRLWVLFRPSMVRCYCVMLRVATTASCVLRAAPLSCHRLVNNCSVNRCSSMPSETFMRAFLTPSPLHNGMGHNGRLLCSVLLTSQLSSFPLAFLVSVLPYLSSLPCFLPLHLPPHSFLACRHTTWATWCLSRSRTPRRRRCSRLRPRVVGRRAGGGQGSEVARVAGTGGQQGSREWRGNAPHCSSHGV